MTQEQTLKAAYTRVGTWPSAEALPIVYHRYSNVSFFGIEKWNRLDGWKLDKTFRLLVDKGVVMDDTHPYPLKGLPVEILRLVHSEEHLQKLENSKMAVIRLTELPALFMVPQFLIERQILTPLKYQSAGTVLAAGIAMERGWSIHLGGGMIHASHDRSVAWCLYDDVSLAIHYLRECSHVHRVTVVDLGAHQGNGYQRTKMQMKDENTFIVDVYNGVIYPHDADARKAIDVDRQLPCGCSGEAYMAAVESALYEASAFVPDVVIYVAGTDVLEEDYSGQMKVSREDVYRRDRMVFEFAQRMHAPVCMLTSSGYAKTNFEAVAESIHRLITDLELS